MKKIIIFNLLFFIIFFSLFAQSNNEKEQSYTSFSLTVKSKTSKEHLEYAHVSLGFEGKFFFAHTNALGQTKFKNIPMREYILRVSYVGFKIYEKKILLSGGSNLIIELEPLSVELKELYVTARESKGLTTESTIGKDAIAHIQPSSFADFLELLPGGYAKPPVYGEFNMISLREGTRSKFQGRYDTPSLGTAFVIDGLQLNTDANMQIMTGNDSEYQKRINSVNKGVDMRSISTDDIDSVVIARGVPSVEYGDLTSGLIQIFRKSGASPWTMRMKSDFQSKLLAVTKGLDLKNDIKLNFSIDYLNASPNARSAIYSYDRITTSARLEKRWNKKNYTAILNTNLDFAKTLDKTTKDADADPTVDYKSGKEKYSFFTKFNLNAKRKSFFKTLTLSASLSQEHQFDEKKTANYSTLWANRFLIIDNTEPGEYDAEILGDYQTIHTKTVIGKPFYASAKAIARFAHVKSSFIYKMNVGSDWTFSKNYGKGEYYDKDKPPYSGFRYRSFSAVPARNNLSFFIENHIIVPYKGNRWQLTAGCRTFALLNMGKEYALNNKLNFDPRINAQWAFPGIRIGEHKLQTAITYGIGWQSKVPTLTHLYPKNSYGDYAMFRFFSDSYHVDPKLSRFHYKTFVHNGSNYNLSVARNIKNDFRIDIDYKKFSLSVNWFWEDLPGGFRRMGNYAPIEYKSYSLIPGHNYKQYEALGEVPYENFPHKNLKMFAPYSSFENGSRTKKTGYEYTFHTPRIKAIATRITVSGASFDTKYQNSAMWWDIAKISTGAGKENLYIGLYKNDDSYRNTKANTNLTFDTHLSQLGLIFTQSYQFHWNENTFRKPRSQFPEYFMTFDERELIAWNDESVAKYSHAYTLIRDVPLIIDKREKWHLIVNLKVTKLLMKDKIVCSAFVNGLLDYFPRDHEDRFGSNPYFGMELSLKL